MNLTVLRKPLLLYTCLLSPLTVGSIHLVTNSGFLVLFSAGIGIILVILAVGTPGTANTGGFDQVEREEDGHQDGRSWPGAGTETPTSLVFLCYGFGMFLWGVIVLQTFYYSFV